VTEGTPGGKVNVPDKAQFPSYRQIRADAGAFVRRHDAIARLESLGVSDEGRDVPAVIVSDPTVASDQKQMALIVCGRHGSELGSRVVGMGVLKWLASEAGAETRRRQHVVVVPVANPDGCVREEFFAPTDGLSALEERTILSLAERYSPDAVVDVHSLGGSDIEAVIAAHTTRCAEDECIQYAVASEMVEAAARQGYPFDIHAAPFPGAYNNFFSGACYERFHSLAFGMEVNHEALGPVEAAASGTEAIAALLAAGNRRAGWQRTRGYPNELLIGSFSTSVRPGGADAAARRRSRVEVWTNRAAFGAVHREMPDAGTVRVTMAYEGNALAAPCELCCRLRGRPKVRRARLNGSSVTQEACYDGSSTFVFAPIAALTAGSYELIIELQLNAL
jgi:hypothetical protein